MWFSNSDLMYIYNTLIFGPYIIINSVVSDFREY